MENRITTYLLDAASGSTFIAGIITGQNLALFLGGLASIMAFVNHLDQYLTRKNNKNINP